MRAMFLLTATALAGAAGAAPMTREVVNAPLCRDVLVHHTGPGRGAKFHRLTELPPASALYAMLERDQDGCIRPVPVGSRSGVVRPGRDRR